MRLLKKVFNIFFQKDLKTSEKKNLTLFDLDKFNRPSYTSNKKCPKCGVEANTNDEAVEMFGIMNIKNGVYIQSWCKSCRKAKKKEVGRAEDKGFL